MNVFLKAIVGSIIATGGTLLGQVQSNNGSLPGLTGWLIDGLVFVTSFNGIYFVPNKSVVESVPSTISGKTIITD